MRVIVTGGAESVGLHAVCAHINIRRSVVDPFFDSEVNVIDTINPLCEAVRAEAMFGFAGRVSLEEGL